MVVRKGESRSSPGIIKAGFERCRPFPLRFVSIQNSAIKTNHKICRGFTFSFINCIHKKSYKGLFTVDAQRTFGYNRPSRKRIDFWVSFFEREKSMIQNAVFVLGAGASCPYGFPTGKELRERILSKYPSNLGAYLSSKERLKSLMPQEVRLAQEFVEKFRKSSTKSIDLFLARNPEYSRMGKRAIIFRILQAESASGFREKARDRDQDWYTWLFEQMTDKLVQKEDYSHFCENDVSFITFNYDRSLEHFLYDSLVNSFIDIPEDKIIEQLNQIKICHVFGQVGPLEWQGQHYDIEYRVGVNSTNVDGLCDNIKIVHEKGGNPKLEEAQELISKAHRVFFLGFGYAEENLDVLGFPNVFADIQQVLGTAMGFTKREMTKATSIFRPDVIKRSVVIENLDCLAFLRKYL